MSLYDLGYPNFAAFQALTEAGVIWLTRAKSNLSYTVDQLLEATAQVRDEIVWVGTGPDRQRVRLVAVLVGSSWRRYLTSELDPGRLPAAYVATLYAQRWRIETLERRKGAKIAALGIYRDAARSRKEYLTKASGLRWISLMLLVQGPWAGKVWALPFFTVLAPSERYHQNQGRRHKTLAA